MNDEMLKYRGKLAQYEHKAAELEVMISANIASVRNLLDPYEDNLEKIKVKQASAEMNSMKNDVLELRKLKNKIKEIQEDLS